jgi:dTDP-4-dehydrorhamnose reductase
MILVVGGTSLIGRALQGEASRAGLLCLGTSRRSDAAVHLDLMAPPASWRLPDGIEQAILCASITGSARCEADPAGTWAVNVTAVSALADRVAAAGGEVAFLSSTQVFPPDASAPAEDSPPAPATEYGRQKLAVERHLLPLGRKAKIIRLTKVVAPTMSLFGGWSESLGAGTAVHAFSDLYFSPLALPLAAAAILRVVTAAEGGIFHLGAADSLSYLEAARWMAGRLGASTALVHPEAAPRPNTPDACRLSCVRARRLTGFGPATAFENLAAAFAGEAVQSARPSVQDLLPCPPPATSAIRRRS